MKTNKKLILRIIGILLTTSMFLVNQNLSDLTKGLVQGIGIGLLLLSIILKPKTTV